MKAVRAAVCWDNVCLTAIREVERVAPSIAGEIARLFIYDTGQDIQRLGGVPTGLIILVDYGSFCSARSNFSPNQKSQSMQ